MVPDVIAKFEGEYAFLSNFHPSPVEVKILGDRMRFPSGEHAFQAMKANAMGDRPAARQYAFELTKNITPGKAKLAGRKADIDVANWDQNKDRAMREVVFSKFLLSADLCGSLLATKTAMLVEGNDWNDTYWGRCNGKGLNRLGSILMEVRGYWYWAGVNDTYPKTTQEAHILMGW